MRFEDVLKELKESSNPKNVEGMARFGINSKNTLGVSVPKLRAIAKKAGKNHELAKKLWASGFHEARILASMVEDPALVSEKQMEEWAKGFDSWDVCDQCCMNLLCVLPFAQKKVFEWAESEKEFVRRASFALIACIAWKCADKEGELEKFFPLIKKHSIDERNYVKKAVNWALRQIGKKNIELNKKAIAVAKQIQEIDSKSAKWIAFDALRELEGEAVQKRLKEKEKKGEKRKK
ncbi:MAG: DNA alkylation repair protein [Candidatus Diapherotrites archaeon]